MTEVWYRYDEVRYASMADPETGEARGIGTVEVRLREYPVLRRTPKGVWLDIGMRFDGCAYDADSIHQRFVLTNARKRFACPTKGDAMLSFRARKKAQIRIYTARIECARRALIAAERVEVAA